MRRFACVSALRLGRDKSDSGHVPAGHSLFFLTDIALRLAVISIAVNSIVLQFVLFPLFLLSGV